MVEPKAKRIIHFIVFLLPALVLYLLFFIVPFIDGIGISLTNWDGLAPKSPISIDKDEFENEILGKLTKQKDKDYLLSVYELSKNGKTYAREGIKSNVRNKVERIIKKTGYEVENYRYVGFENYKKIFTGQVKEDFYPRWYEERKYNISSSLPMFITKEDFKKEILKNSTDFQAEVIKSHYEPFVDRKGNEKYRLKSEYDDFEIKDSIWMECENLDSKVVDTYLRDLDRAVIARDADEKDTLLSVFLTENEFSDESKAVITESTEKLYELGDVRKILSEVWVLKRFNMGVTGFTLFFAFFSVICINLVAFLLALALDTKMRGQTIFRSIFFLPNVLSMVIVALIWSMMFVQLLPALTGIEHWLSDSAKTPWLLVLVATWQGAGYYMIVYLAGLQSIPTDIIEAAKIDGASAFQRFRSITLPMLIPALTISLFLSIANALKSFDLIYALLGPTGYATGTVPFVMDIYYDAFAQKQAGLATAKAMILFVVIFIITGIQLFVMKRKEIEQ